MKHLVLFLITCSICMAMKTPLQSLKQEDKQLKSKRKPRVMESYQMMDQIKSYNRDKIFFLLDEWMKQRSNIG